MIFFSTQELPVSERNRVSGVTMWQSFKRFLASEDGPTSVEYAVMLMMIIVTCIASIQVIGNWAGSSFQNSSDEIDTYLS